jgi:hypothetical protein
MYIELNKKLLKHVHADRVRAYTGLARYVQHADHYISPGRDNRAQLLETIRTLGSNYVWAMQYDLQEGTLQEPESYIEEAFWATYEGLCIGVESALRQKTLYFMLRRIVFAAYHKGYISKPDYIYKDFSAVRSSYKPYIRAKRHLLYKVKRQLKKTYEHKGFTTGGLLLFLMVYSGRPLKDVRYFTWNSFVYTKQGYFKAVKHKGDRYYRTPRWFNEAFIMWGEGENIDLDSEYIIQRMDGSGKPYKDVGILRKLINSSLMECGLENDYTLHYISVLLRKTRARNKRKGTGQLGRIDTFFKYTIPYVEMLARRGKFYKAIKR